MRAGVLGCLLGAAIPLSACSSGDSASRTGSDAGDAASPYDDDTARLAHCQFETPPTHSPGPAPLPAALSAGVAARLLQLPIGAPMGGYGARSTTIGGRGKQIQLDARAARWSTKFIPSAGVHAIPRAEAIALEVGGEKLVIIRSDVIVVTENVVFAVEKAIAPDGSMRGHVIIAASHSHASWSNWIPSFALMPGIDAPRKDLFDVAVATYAGVATDALAALEPARIGFSIAQGVDPDSIVSHDRRTENNNLLAPDGNTAGKDKDHVAWAMRLDRADGTPLAALIDFPIHGVVGSDSNAITTTDAPGAIAHALGESLGYPVFHLQGAAGDVNPAGVTGRVVCPDAQHCLDIPNLETIGALAVPMLAPIIQGVTTHDQLAMEVVTRTFYAGHAGIVKRPDGTQLYYPPPGDYVPDGRIFDDQGKVITPLDEFNTIGGAALCGSIGAGSFAAIAGDNQVGAYSSCANVDTIGPVIAGLFDLPQFDLPLCDTVRDTATAVRFDTGDGDPLLLLTVPGEPTAPFTAYLRGRSPAGPDHTLVLGYAQDYLGYVLTAEDWLSGGYEPSLNVWGPLEGEQVLQGILDGAAIAWTPEKEDPEVGSSRFPEFPFPSREPITPVVTTDHGTVPSTLPTTLFLPETKTIPASAQPDAQIPRATGVARFVWLGGDPAVDFPSVVVERETSPGAFAPYADTTFGNVVITYTPDPIAAKAPTRHYYAASWQPVPPEPFSLDKPAAPYALPLGKYRFKVTGTAHTGAGDASYSVTSNVFEIVAAPLGSATAKRAGGTLDVTALLGSAPGLRALRKGPSDQGVPLPGPWSVTVTFSDATTTTTSVTPTDGAGSVTLSATDVTRATSVDVRDAAGNGGAMPVTG